MPTLSTQQVYQLALDQGLTPNAAVMATAIAWRESRFQTDAVGVNSDAYHSRDRGLWQINDHWSPDVTDGCAFDPVCNAATMARLSNKGTNWKPWSSYNNHALDDAMAKVNSDLQKSGGLGEKLEGASNSSDDSGFSLTDLLAIPAKFAAGVLWITNPRNSLRMLQFVMGIVACIVGVLAVRKAAA